MSSILFNLDEIFEVAETIERNGARFYGFAAEVVSDGKMAQLLGELARMEVDHEQLFKTLRKELVTWEYRSPALDDPQDPTWEYLTALASEHVFDSREDPLARLKTLDSVEDILTLAIQKEKDTIVFYVGLQGLMDPHRGQQQLDVVIKEEMKHVAMLTRARELVRENQASA